VKPKHQRLTLSLLALGTVVGAGALAVSGLGEKAAYFYAPADIAKARPAAGEAIRLGGMVADKSVLHDKDGVTITFTVTDGLAVTPVRFKGIVPDLFREKSGVVAEGAFDQSGIFVASNILAKHDERYMPPEIAGKMHKTGSVK
jgi:cytochrome c-type biogenesis protein CcmE